MEINTAVGYILYIGLDCGIINLVPRHLKSRYLQYLSRRKLYINHYKYRRGQKHIVYIAGHIFGPIARPLVGRNNNNNANNFVMARFAIMVRSGKDFIY